MPALLTRLLRKLAPVSVLLSIGLIHVDLYSLDLVGDSINARLGGHVRLDR